MPIQEHEPLSNEPILPSEEKRKLYASPWGKNGQTWIMVFHHSMNTTARPTNPNQKIGTGYQINNKFHDRESGVIVDAIEKIDPKWFDPYPRKPTTVLDFEFKKAIVGELARVFYRFGLSAYGKPGLRKQTEEPNAPLGAL